MNSRHSFTTCNNHINGLNCIEFYTNVVLFLIILFKGVCVVVLFLFYKIETYTKIIIIFKI